MPLAITYDKPSDMFTIVDGSGKTVRVSSFSILNYVVRSNNGRHLNQHHQIAWRGGTVVHVGKTEIDAAERLIRGAAADAGVPTTPYR